MSSNSPLMFESDDEKEPGDVEPVTIEETNISSKTGIEVQTEEHKLVDMLRTILTGVPPPPGVTISQYDAGEIHQNIKEYYVHFKWTESVNDTLQRNEMEQRSKSDKWPSVRDCHYYSVYYNRGPVSEELTSLITKYQERYIGNETSSSVNSFFSKSPITTASAKKRARRHAWGHSPGRRLSHLARRRHTFSSANLQLNNNRSLPDKKKMILVDKRKLDGNKRGIKISATKALGGNERSKLVPQTTLSNSKRALFQSPESDKKMKKSVLSEKTQTLPCTTSIQKSKRALWPDPPVLERLIKKNKENGSGYCVNANGKRVELEKSTTGFTPKKKCSKNDNTSLRVSDSQMPKLVPSALSQLHKQKLLWAVSDALRIDGITMEHKLFKTCAAELFKICKEIWLKNYKQSANHKSGSTSDKMLILTKKFSKDIVKKIKLKVDLLKKPNDSNCSDSHNLSVKKQSFSSCNKSCSDEPEHSNFTNNLGNNVIGSTNSMDYNNYECNKNERKQTGNVSKETNHLINIQIQSSDHISENSSNYTRLKLSKNYDSIREQNLQLTEKDKCDKQSNALAVLKLHEYFTVFGKNVNNKSSKNVSTGNTDDDKSATSTKIIADSVNDDSVVFYLNGNVEKEIFSPASTAVINECGSESTRCSSSCDIDVAAIIDSMESSDGSDCDDTMVLDPNKVIF